MAEPSLEEAFIGNPALLARVQAAVSTGGQLEASLWLPLMMDVASHVLHLKQDNDYLRRAVHETQTEENLRPAKRRRQLDEDNSHSDSRSSTTPHHGSSDAYNDHNHEQTSDAQPAVYDDHNKPEAPVVRFEEVTFHLPKRGRYVMEIIAANSNGDGSIWARPINGNKDSDISLCWDEMEHIFSIPVPEKTGSHLIFLPRNRVDYPESIVLTLPATTPKGFRSIDPDVSIREDETFNFLMKRVINVQLAHLGRRVTVPEEREFISSIVQAHRPNEKHYWVKAHKGRQEGYLHFLPSGILWGFKKPIIFFPFSNIHSISYTNVLSRTFNLVVTPNAPDLFSGSREDVIFEMLDQREHQGIDAYVQRHRLHDASMAAERKAQLHNVNGRQSHGAASEDGEDDEAAAAGSRPPMTEAEIQDAEDAEEEDFDPSGGGSDGSGSETDEEESGEEEAEEGLQFSVVAHAGHP